MASSPISISTAPKAAVTPPVTPLPTPQQVHHSWVNILLQILKLAAAVAPAAALPFAAPGTEQIIAGESQLAGTILGGIDINQGG